MYVYNLQGKGRGVEPGATTGAGGGVTAAVPPTDPPGASVRNGANKISLVNSRSIME